MVLLPRNVKGTDSQALGSAYMKSTRPKHADHEELSMQAPMRMKSETHTGSNT